MSNEALGLPYNSTIGLSSLEPGLLPDDIIRWDGTQWQITQNDHVASPILLPGVPPTFNPEGTPPDVNAGYLYKKNGLPGLYWYPDGGPEINLLGGGGIPVIGASTNQAIVRWDGVTGDALLDSGVTLTNSNEFFQGLKRIMAFGAATENTAVGADAIRNALGNHNTAVGYESGFSHTTATDNTFVGHYAGRNVTTHGSATGVGASALENNNGAENVAVGYHAMRANTIGSSSVGVGYNALSSNTTGSNNTALGNRALQSLITSDMNTAVGSNTLTNNTAADNTAIGGNSLATNTTGTHNAALGDRSLELNTIGNENTAVGSYSLANNSTGSNNTAVGYRALVNNTTDNNTAVGFQAMESNITGTGNTAIGAQSLMGNSGDQNTALGYNAGFSNTTGDNNIFVGWNAGHSNTTGDSNVLLGTNADVDVAARSGAVVIGDSAVSAPFDNSLTINKIRGPAATANGLYYNTATGEVTYAAAGGGGSTFADSAFRVQDNGDPTKELAFEVSAVTTATTRTVTVPDHNGILPVQPVAAALMTGNTSYPVSGANNVAYGLNAGDAITTGTDNVAIGVNAASAVTTGSRNVAIGTDALLLSTADNNVAIGPLALDENTTGSNNIAVGLAALSSNITGTQNVAIGVSTLFTNTGNANTGVGNGVMTSLTSGNANTCIGASSGGDITTGNNNISVGTSSNVGVGNGAFNDTINLGHTSVPATGSFVVRPSSVRNQTGPNLLYFDNATGEVSRNAVGTLDHGGLAGLGDNDHPQYLLRDGTNAMTGDLNMGSRSITSIATGTVGAPSMAFTGDPNTGIYSPSAGVLGLTSNGVEAARLNANQISLATRGTVTAPAYSFTADPNTGIYSSAEDTIDFANGGNIRYSFSLAALNINSPIRSYVGNINMPPYSFTGDTATGIYSPATGVIGLTSLGFETSRLDANQLSLTTRGSAATPAYSFTPDTNTGIYSAAADTLNITTGGVNRLGINTSTVTSTLPLVAPGGTYASPAFQFGASSGIYRYDANTIEISQGLAGDGGSAYLARFSPLGGWSQIRTSNAGLTKPNVFIDQQYYGGNLTAGYGMLSLGDAYTSTGTAWNHILCWNNGGNSFRVQGNGAVYADNAYSSSGADYAEYFESTDGKSIPIGSTVVLVDGKIRQATVADSADDVIGVIRPKNSPDVAAISNVFEDYWSGKYEKDEFGEPVEESYTAYNWAVDGKTVSYHADRIPAGVVVPETKNTVMSTRLKWSPTYDPTSVYVPRSQRIEWHVVGLLGQIPIKNGEIINPRWVLMGNIGDGSVAKKYLVR